MKTVIPIFPLNSVLFPGASIDLRIFEVRYLDMVSECLRTGIEFGICLIRQGSEVGQPAEHYSTGTSAQITDWEQYPDGILGITAMGHKRFIIESSSVRSNNLIEGKIHWVENLPKVSVTQEYKHLQEMYYRLASHFEIQSSADPLMIEDTSWLGYRLADMLPLDAELKQEILEIDDCLQRLNHLRELIENAGLLKLDS